MMLSTSCSVNFMWPIVIHLSWCFQTSTSPHDYLRRTLHQPGHSKQAPFRIHLKRLHALQIDRLSCPPQLIKV
ncbi:hypothetical protein EDB19DRAFT_1654939 [Suillus lakei]|nr:hypothetical protein EDB19DRAFT_1654939 [Suillus lakei]